MSPIIATCEKYGVGEVSQCTHSFPHIDEVAGKTKLETSDRRQVVIPDINFSCNGTITRWIVGAKWEGKTNTYTELQIWRRISTTNQYMKVNGTNITVSRENASEIYELETSLAFQEGDVLGYFQQDKDESKLDLYLDNSKTIVTYHHDLKHDELTPPAAGDVSPNMNRNYSKYPLIAVKTGM